MMKPPRLDGAPGHRWQPRADGKWVCLWIARRDKVQDGYTPKTQRIWPPTATPDADFDESSLLYIRSECRRLQEDMLAYGKLADGGGPSVFDGTIDSLIECFKSDPDSDYQNLRFKSRETYSAHLKQVSKAVGKRSLAEIKGRDFKRWYENWAADGKHIPRAHYRMTLIRLIISFGVGILEDKHCMRLNTILAEQSYAGGKARKSTMTAEQVNAIRHHARGAGRPGLALGEAMKFELWLRPKDVFGEWLPTSEPGISAVISAGQKWICGLDWSEVDQGMQLVHRISKSVRGRKAVADQSAGKVKKFQLTLYPMVMEELALMADVTPAEVRRELFPASGPIVVNATTGLPYRAFTQRKHWREAATMAGVPKSVQSRDSRASGATEAEKMGMDEETIRKGLGHAKVETTRIYTRGEDEATANIAEFKAAKRLANKVANTD